MEPVVAIFIDGNYLRRVAKDFFEIENFDYAAFIQKVQDKLVDVVGTTVKLLRVYYYDAPPYQFKDATPAEKRFYQKRQAFLERLNTLDYFEVKLGRVQYKGRDEHGRRILTQKGVDVQIAVDMIHLAKLQIVDILLLITGDSDLVPAIQLTKNEGVQVFLMCSPKQNRKAPSVSTLLKSVDKTIPLTKDLFKSINQ